MRRSLLVLIGAALCGGFISALTGTASAENCSSVFRRSNAFCRHAEAANLDQCLANAKDHYAGCLIDGCWRGSYVNNCGFERR
jgi:hypothetical protein